MSEQNQASQATGSSVAENLATLIQQAAGTHTSPAFSRALGVSSEILGVVADEIESALHDKIDVQTLNNGLQDVLVGSQQAERGVVAVYGALSAHRKSDATTDATAEPSNHSA